MIDRRSSFIIFLIRNFSIRSNLFACKYITDLWKNEGINTNIKIDFHIINNSIASNFIKFLDIYQPQE